MTEKGIKPRDIVTPASLRNALTVAIALGGSTNVVLHGVEIARAAGIDLWADVLSQLEFNALSRKLPVLVDAKPFGRHYMIDIDAKGGLPVIVKELLNAGLLDGDCLTCTGETLAEQVARLNPPAPDGDVIHSVTTPYKETGGLRLLTGNLAPGGGAVLKVAGIEGGLEGGVFTGRDALAKIQAGASLVQLYSSFALHGPALIPKLKAELLTALRDARFASVQDAVGTRAQELAEQT